MRITEAGRTRQLRAAVAVCNVLLRLLPLLRIAAHSAVGLRFPPSVCKQAPSSANSDNT